MHSNEYDLRVVKVCYLLPLNSLFFLEASLFNFSNNMKYKPVKCSHKASAMTAPVLCSQLTFYADLQDDVRVTALPEATIGLHRRYRKNVLMKWMNLLEASTTIERNSKIEEPRKLIPQPIETWSTYPPTIPRWVWETGQNCSPPFWALHGFDIEILTKEHDQLLVSRVTLGTDQKRADPLQADRSSVWPEGYSYLFQAGERAGFSRENRLY